MTKLAPEWVRTSDPVIRSPARYRWTTAPAKRNAWTAEESSEGVYNLPFTASQDPESMATAEPMMEGADNPPLYVSLDPTTAEPVI